MPLDERFMLEEWDLTNVKKGDLVRSFNEREEEKQILPLRFNTCRNIVSELSRFYMEGRMPTQSQLKKIWEKHRDEAESQITEIIDDIGNEDKDMFQVVEKKKKGDEITFKLKKVDSKERIELIKNIAKQVAKKLTKEQIEVMIQEGLRKNGSLKDLKDVNKELKKANPKIESARGCFKIKVNKKEIMLIS